MCNDFEKQVIFPGLVNENQTAVFSNRVSYKIRPITKRFHVDILPLAPHLLPIWGRALIIFRTLRARQNP